MDNVVFITWLHLAGIVTWVGLWLNTLFAFRPLRKRLNNSMQADFIRDYQHRYSAITWSATGVFIATGTILMLSDENYPGLAQFFDSEWATLIFLKHIVVIGMIILSLSLLYGILPRLRRAMESGDQAAIDRQMRSEGAAVGWLAVLGLAVLFIIAAVGGLHGD